MKIPRKSDSMIIILRRLGLIIFISIILVLALFAQNRNRNPYNLAKDKLHTLSEILYYLNHDYFEPIDIDKLMEGAFDGIMRELDPHSIYIPEEQLANIDEQFQGKFQGIGIEFDLLHGYITVIAPVADSPAERVGLLPGDKIISIDGVDAYEITREEVFTTLRGKKGSRVDVSIQRIGEERPFDVTIIRDDIPIYSVRTALMLDDSTGYIWLTRFSATSMKEVLSALEFLEEQGMTRLLFDLRNNSGGLLTQAAQISNLFINTADTLVYTKGNRPEMEQVFIAEHERAAIDCPVIVLVNRGSASASEIVAGAIQDLDRGLIVGETTFGKGLVQRQIPLSDGSAIRVTIARYYTPSGRLIQRPFENGNDHAYYEGFLEEDRESTIDSLKGSRPQFHTRAGRTVYGGGGITPDLHIPWESQIGIATQKILADPKRPAFNWASAFSAEYRMELGDFTDFFNNWELTNTDFDAFLTFLDLEDIPYDSSLVAADKDYLLNYLKSQVAGSVWSRNELFIIRLSYDNQVTESIKHFEEAAGFINQKP